MVGRRIVQVGRSGQWWQLRRFRGVYSMSEIDGDSQFPYLDTERYSIRVTMERDGHTLEVQASTVWQEQKGQADGPWCFAMRIKEVLETLKTHMVYDEWEGFVRGVKMIGDE
jgi:hypothetical protein